MTDPYVLHRGDCLAILQTLPTASVDALVTDPPYSSGGFTRGDRTARPYEKYVQTGTQIIRGGFSGDNRDGVKLVLLDGIVAVGVCADRQAGRLRARRSAIGDNCLWRLMGLQAGGFVWRGIVSWDKGEGARAPHTGYFRHQCEFVVWGTNGVSAPGASWGGPWSGCMSHPVLQSDKHHLTGKPTPLLERLVQCAHRRAASCSTRLWVQVRRAWRRCAWGGDS